MTPLASHLAKQIIARPKHRDEAWRDPAKVAMLQDLLNDIHCFEVSACVDLMLDMVEKFVADWDVEKTEEMFGDYAFLPAPKTWIEWRDAKSGLRIAMLFEQLGDWSAKGTFFTHKYGRYAGSISLTSPYQYAQDGRRRLPAWAHEADDSEHAIMTWAHAMLPLLNSPHIIERESHSPNRNLERKLSRETEEPFAIRPWTELKLEVNKPMESDDGEPHEDRLTGKRAHHFVRKHLRLKRGRLEHVSSHWRGDASLGQKPAHYVVVP